MDISWCTNTIVQAVYLCEKGFSCLTQIKTKIRNSLDQNLDTTMRCALAKHFPRFKLIIGSEQQQISH